MDNLQAVIDAARQGVAPVTIKEIGSAVVIWTQRGGVETIDTEAHGAAPTRKRGTVTVFDAESLNRMLVDHSIAGQTMAYVNPDASRPAIVAVFNGNGLGGPGFGDHRAAIGFRETPQWQKWKAIDGKLMPQPEFAEFIEDNLQDIASPDGATMMEIVTYLHATRTVDFKSGVKLSSGAVQLTNIEDVQASVGAGNIAVPDMFEIALSPIFGVAPFKIPARFRYWIEQGKLRLGLKLLRLEDVMAQIIKEIEAEIVLPEGVGKVYGVAP